MMSEEFVLQRALEQYALTGASTHLLGTLWNRTYRIDKDDGVQFVLRICPEIFQNKQSLQDELAWLTLVTRQSHLYVPVPIANQPGQFVTEVQTPQGNRLCCLFNWIEGVNARTCLTPAVLQEMGRIAATLHLIAKDFGIPATHKDFRASYRYDTSLLNEHREWIDECRAEIGSGNCDLLFAALDWATLAPFIVAVHLAFLDWFYNSPNPEVCAANTPLFHRKYQAIRQYLRRAKVIR